VNLTIMAKAATVFVLFIVTLGMNLDDNLIARIGMPGNHVMILMTAIAFTLFVAGRNAFIIAGAVGLSLIANMPADFLLNFGFDRDLYAGMMIAVLCQPVLARILS
jgi:hypothetical protein